MDRESNGGQLLFGLGIFPVPAIKGEVAAIGRFVDYDGVGGVGADVAFMTEIGALQGLGVGSLQLCETAAIFQRKGDGGTIVDREFELCNYGESILCYTSVLLCYRR